MDLLLRIFEELSKNLYPLCVEISQKYNIIHSGVAKFFTARASSNLPPPHPNSNFLTKCVYF